MSLLTPGQAGDSPMFLPLLEQLRVGRSVGRPRTRPVAVGGNKAYSSRAIRGHLRERGITAVIPEPDERILSDRIFSEAVTAGPDLRSTNVAVALESDRSVAVLSQLSEDVRVLIRQRSNDQCNRCALSAFGPSVALDEIRAFCGGGNRALLT